MKLVNLRCDSCNAQLEVDLDNLMTYCPYCGRKLLIDIDHIDEILKEKEKTRRAQDQSQENMFREQEQTKRAKMEHEYKEQAEKRDNKQFLICICALLFLCFIPWMYLEISEWFGKINHAQQNEVQISISSDEIDGKTYENIKDILKSDGFENIKIVPVDDIFFGLLVKEGEVKSVTINGHDTFSKGDWFSADANIVVEYHTKS